MPVKVAGLRLLFLALRSHPGRIGCARLAARTKLTTRHLIFGFAFFFADLFGHQASERTVRAAKEPTEPKRNGHRRIGLSFNRIAERALQ
jgi:hypothetical protein